MTNKLYRNANGNQYEILRIVGDVGLLKNTDADANHPYIVAISFSPYVDSWGQGKYYRTLNDAREKFDSITN